MSDYVFELENVSFYYKNFKTMSILHWLYPNKYHVVPVKFKALDNISLNIRKGTRVGMIGRNGSGKTSLIRLLAGIYEPDEGVMRTNSDSIAMLGLGIGFEGAASGYDNIYLSSLLRGYRKKEVDEKVEEIIDFSGIRESIYNPVKTYSSGMRARLAFSIAIHFSPDVLLVDEALAVGDAQFQKKSSEKMHELIRDKTKTVILVSHSISFLQSECDEVIWLDKGKVKMFDKSDAVLKSYNLNG